MRAWRADQAIQYIRDNRGIQFDPMVVDRFIDVCAIRLVELLPAATTPLANGELTDEIERR